MTDHNNNTIDFDKTELSTITDNLKLLCFTMDTEVSVGYVRFSVSYAADRNVVLLTEIEIARHHSNLVTGRNVTQLSYTQQPLATYNTTTIYGMSTNKTTNTTTNPTFQPTLLTQQQQQPGTGLEVSHQLPLRHWRCLQEGVSSYKGGTTRKMKGYTMAPLPLPVSRVETKQQQQLLIHLEIE